MAKVKIIAGTGIDLEDQINNFLKDKRYIDIKFELMGEFHPQYVIIVYE